MHFDAYAANTRWCPTPMPQMSFITALGIPEILMLFSNKFICDREIWQPEPRRWWLPLNVFSFCQPAYEDRNTAWYVRRISSSAGLPYIIPTKKSSNGFSSCNLFSVAATFWKLQRFNKTKETAFTASITDDTFHYILFPHPAYFHLCRPVFNF